MHSALECERDGRDACDRHHVYFWWENIKGVPESSGKALRIMQLTTIMVVVLIGWCVYTLWVRQRLASASLAQTRTT